MAVTVWQNSTVKFADVELTAAGIAVSCAVWKSGTDVKLRFKLASGTGAWPADDDSYIIAPLAKSEPFFVRQLSDGALLVGNGKDKFWRADTSQPTKASDWKSVNIIP